jgi:DNA-binding response OmpR family regulator
VSEETRKILLVEDEKVIRDAVAAYLEREHYKVVAVGDGQEAIDEFERQEFALVILDLMLLTVQGDVVCRKIREKSDVPLIMLTAKSEIEDRIIGLEMGADDYLVKPFSPRELMARVRALMRRSNISTESVSERLEFGRLDIDIAGHRVFVDGTEVELTA